MSRIDKDMNLMISTAISLSVSLSTGLMFIMHTYMILTNRTTIENRSLTKENPFDKGFYENWKQVFGERWLLLWMLPLKPELNMID